MIEEKLIRGSIELNKMFLALKRTADSIRHDFGEVENLQQSITGARGFVKKAEERIEEMILSDLSLVRPRAGLLTRHVSRAGDGRDEFALALSGAENFVRGVPHFAISLALRTMGETKISLVYDPIADRLYYGEAGEGSYLFSPYHSQRLRVSLDGAESPFGWNTGCPALDMAYVAAGKFDRITLPQLDYAEICAGELLVLEAGGTVSSAGADIIVSNNSDANAHDKSR